MLTIKPRRSLALALSTVALLAASVSGCAKNKEGFDTPEAAVKSFVDLACKGDTVGLNKLLTLASAPAKTTAAEIVDGLSVSCSHGVPTVRVEKYTQDLPLRKAALFSLSYADSKSIRHALAVNKHEDGWLVDGADVMLNVPSDDERALNYLPIFGNQIAAAVKMYRELEGALPKSVSDLMKKDYLAGLPANPGGAPWVINADKKTISVALPPDLCAQLNQKMTEAGDSRGSCENGEYSQLF